jgi:hypothetical protein
MPTGAHSYDAAACARLTGTRSGFTIDSSDFMLGTPYEACPRTVQSRGYTAFHTASLGLTCPQLCFKS